MSSFPATDLIVNSIFVLCLATMAAGALLAVTTSRLIRSVCGLAVCSMGLAGLYYFLHSPFLALMEILIYIGAVCVTIVFAVMLAEPEEPANEEKPAAVVLWGGMALAAAGGIFWGLTRLGLHASWPAPQAPTESGSIQAIGVSLLTTYSLAFELISLVLLVAIIGSLAIARLGRHGATPARPLATADREPSPAGPEPEIAHATAAAPDSLP